MVCKSLKILLALVAALAIASCGNKGGGGAGTGSPCETHSDCEGLCFDPGGGADPYCTDTCDRTADDCPAGYECTRVNNIGYVCVRQTGIPLGDPCTDGAECASGFCNHGVCSECESNADCAGGGTCVLDTDLDYYVCQGGGLGDLGDPCTTGADCNSGFCFDTPGPGDGVCSECENNGDCTGEEVCTYSAGDQYATCTGGGLANLGEPCTDGAECNSGFCNNDVCSECEDNGDCAGGGTCVLDTDLGYYVCQGGALGDLGDPCTDGAECNSGFCYVTTGPQPDICSECEDNGDCTAPQECSYNRMAGDTYAHCRGTGALGEACTSGTECASGFCNGDVCSECMTNADCTGGGTCVDDLAGVGYFVCQGGLGDTCTTGTDCGSGFCYNAPYGPDVCSECETTADCTTGTCQWSGPDRYAVCR